MKLLKNKKGIATSLTIDILSIVAFFLAFLIVYISIIVAGSPDSGVCVEKIKEDSTMQLLNILRTPMEVNNQDITIAEYLTIYDSDANLKEEDAREKIRQRMEEVGLYSSLYCLSFDFEQKDRIVISPAGGIYNVDACAGGIVARNIPGARVLDGEKVAETKFPNKNGNIINAASYVDKAFIRECKNE